MASPACRFGEIAVKPILVVILSCLCLGGCGVAAAPCRLGSAVIKMVPFVGHEAAAPTDSCAGALDPDAVSGS
jgi:hypothetical protein